MCYYNNGYGYSHSKRIGINIFRLVGLVGDFQHRKQYDCQTFGL